jgi:hypothetical protein
MGKSKTTCSVSLLDTLFRTCIKVRSSTFVNNKFDIYSKIFFRDVGKKKLFSIPVWIGPASPDAGVELLRQLFLQCSKPCTKYFFHTAHFSLYCICPHRLASWAGSCAGSPVSEYMSLMMTFSCCSIWFLLLFSCSKRTYTRQSLS